MQVMDANLSQYYKRVVKRRFLRAFMNAQHIPAGLIKHKKLICLALVGVMLLTQAWSVFVAHLDHEAATYRGMLRFKVQSSIYQQAAARKARLPRTKAFQQATPQDILQQLPVYVISLARATERRQTMAATFAAAGVTDYELLDAVDYHNATSVSTDELHKYTHGWRRYMWQHNRTRYSSKIAVDLSHYGLWERIAAGEQPAVILEDDVRLTGPTWTQDLITVLQELPEDWDVLYLTAGCCQELGKNVSQHLVPVFGTAGAMAYIMTPAFAKRAIEVAADPRSNTWVDLILLLMARHFEGNMYLAQPPLVQPGNLPTTLSSHYTDPETDNWWERLWIRYGGLLN